MLFNSLSFLGFFAALVGVYYASPHRFRWSVLLLASIYSYAAFNAGFVLLLLGVSGIGYIGGLQIARAPTRSRQRIWLTASVVVVLGVLLANKYYDFFAAAVNGLSDSTALRLPRADLAVAAGLSFYSFSCVSYLFDVAAGRLPAESHLGKFTLYLAFFPKLLAGPLERAQPFLSQLEVPARFDAARVTAGLQLMLWGLFKKVVIADRLAPMVDAAYRQPTLASPADLLLATYFFAFQLYCDFSGYSDIAIGAAGVLGFDLIENFRRPYLATTVREFWARRWHLSLSAWFRDYLYIPLGGNRVSTARRCLNIMVVFLLSGLWHGANWTFLVWGGLNGLYQVVGLLRGRGSRSEPKMASFSLRSGLGVLVTFHLVLVTWVFFRAASIADAVAIISRVIAAAGSLPGLVWIRLQDAEVVIACALILLLLAVEAVDDVRSIWVRLEAKPVYMRWAAYYALLLLLLVMGNWNLTQFVYMQF